MKILLGFFLVLFVWAFFVLLLTILLRFGLKKVRRGAVEIFIAVFLTFNFILRGYESLLRGGKSFSEGLCSESWVPTIVVITTTSAIVFIVNLLFARLARLGALNRVGKQ